MTHLSIHTRAPPPHFPPAITLLPFTIAITASFYWRTFLKQNWHDWTSNLYPSKRTYFRINFNQDSTASNPLACWKCVSFLGQQCQLQTSPFYGGNFSAYNRRSWDWNILHRLPETLAPLGMRRRSLRCLLKSLDTTTMMNHPLLPYYREGFQGALMMPKGGRLHAWTKYIFAQARQPNLLLRAIKMNQMGAK